MAIVSELIFADTGTLITTPCVTAPLIAPSVPESAFIYIKTRAEVIVFVVSGRTVAHVGAVGVIAQLIALIESFRAFIHILA